MFLLLLLCQQCQGVQSCFYAVDAHDMVAMNDAHGTCVTCHHVMSSFVVHAFSAERQCQYAIPESWFIRVSL